MIDTTQYDAQLEAFNQASDRYINDLIAQAQGDKDFAIKLLTRDHELALGTDDAARAKFLEQVSDKLEEKIGTIPYDYQVGTTRENENLARITEVTNRNKNQALARLAEDEKVWKDQFADTSKTARGSQQEQLLQRGILSGTRSDAQGLAGQEVGKLETDLSKQLEAYNREIGRSTQDINTQASDTLFTAGREATRTLENLKTDARRGATAASDTFKFGSEKAQRALDAQKKALEQQRELSKLSNQTYAL